MSFSPRSWLPWGSSGPSPSSIQLPSSPPPPPQSAAPHSPPADETSATPPIPQHKRTARQLGLFVGGSAFLLLTLRFSVRSVYRRRLATVPQFYQPSNLPPPMQGSSATDAMAALQLATLGVTSFAMMMVGGGAFALDVASVEELRRKFKGSEKGEEWTRMEREMEEEFEEWVVDVLARKEVKEEARRRARDRMEGEGKAR